LHDITGTSRFSKARLAISGNLASSRLLSQQGLSINVYPEYLCPKKAEILPAHENVKKIDKALFFRCILEEYDEWCSGFSCSLAYR
jgi:hypothetical protein